MKMGFAVWKLRYNGPVSPRDRCMEKKEFRGATPELRGASLIRKGQTQGLEVPQAVPTLLQGSTLGVLVSPACRVRG